MDLRIKFNHHDYLNEYDEELEKLEAVNTQNLATWQLLYELQDEAEKSIRERSLFGPCDKNTGYGFSEPTCLIRRRFGTDGLTQIIRLDEGDAIEAMRWCDFDIWCAPFRTSDTTAGDGFSEPACLIRHRLGTDGQKKMIRFDKGDAIQVMRWCDFEKWASVNHTAEWVHHSISPYKETAKLDAGDAI